MNGNIIDGQRYEDVVRVSGLGSDYRELAITVDCIASPIQGDIFGVGYDGKNTYLGSFWHRYEILKVFSANGNIAWMQVNIAETRNDNWYHIMQHVIKEFLL